MNSLISSVTVYTYQSIFGWTHHGTKDTPQLQSSNLSRNKRLAVQPSLLLRSFLLVRRLKSRERKLELNHSYIRRELSSLFINRYIPGPHAPFSVHFSRWRINTCIIMDLSSMIPLISASSWTKRAWTLEIVETKSMKGTISHVSTCHHGLLLQCIRCGFIRAVQALWFRPPFWWVGKA